MALKLATAEPIAADPLRADLASKIEAAKRCHLALHATRARHAKATLAARDAATALATAEAEVVAARERRIAQVAAGMAPLIARLLIRQQYRRHLER